jgi:hypothetical protein
MYFQSIVLIQPIDTLADGSANMCDGCPDMTVYNGELVWSCRLEERLQHGCLLQAVPKDANQCADKRHLKTVPPSSEDPDSVAARAS